MTWDPLLRIFHWSLAGFFFLAYLLPGGWLAMHSHAGYTVGLLVAFRCLWGVIGPTHALFADFVAPPGVVAAYLRQLARGNAGPRPGHDPAGAVMIVLLLISLLVTTFAGMSLFGMEGSGPFANTFVSRWPAGVVEDVHVFFADFTLALVIVHVSGVLFMSVLKRENLIRAMITGRKRPRL